MKKMKKILVFGAGVLGSLYAARLKQSGNDVQNFWSDPNPKMPKVSIQVAAQTSYAEYQENFYIDKQTGSAALRY